MMKHVGTLRLLTMLSLVTIGPCLLVEAQDLPSFAEHVYGYTWATAAGNSSAYGVALDSAGNLVVVGHRTSSISGQQTSAIISKYDQTGNILWWSEWEEGSIDPDLAPNEHGKWSSSDDYFCVGVDGDDNIYTGGRVSGVWAGEVEGSWIDAMWLRRFTPGGTLDWDRRYQDTTGSAWQWFNGLDVAPDGGVYVTGPSMGRWGDVEYRWTTLAYDRRGDITLGPIQHNASSSLDLQDHSYDVAILPGGGFVTVGTIGVSGTTPMRDYDWHVRFHDADGQLNRSFTHGHSAGLRDVARGVCIVQDSMVYVVGHVNSGTDNADGRDLDARVYRFSLDGVPELNWILRKEGTNEAFYDVECDANGYVYMAGFRTGPDGRTEGWILKYDPLSSVALAEQVFPEMESIYDIDIRNGQIAVAGTEWDGEKVNFHAWIGNLIAAEGEGEGEGEGEEDCDTWCADTTADSDGDGLTDCQECGLLGTDPDSADTDGDGIPDGYEVEHELDPLRFSADEDTDGDGMTDLEEFLRDSDPTSFGDPSAVYYVSTTGADNPTNGTFQNPWATIGFA